jgi:pimeloyl-ACP methyl ester carboxylesterase
MNEIIVDNVGPSKIRIAYERLGDSEAPPVLLIHGLAAQLISWPDGFCSALVEAGLQVIRFDNRDVGHSTHIADAPVPNLPAVLAGDFSSVSYTLSDMAADAVGLLDTLGIESAHLVGASMGGAIAQTIAIEYPHRVLSLTSMMSTTGNGKVGQPSAKTMKELFGGASPVTREEVIEQQARAYELIGSPAFPGNPALIHANAARAYERGFDSQGIARQAVATIASGDRTNKLHKITAPTLVIHGMDDLMCDVSGGRAVAGAIAGSRLVLIKGMGHNLPAGLWGEFADQISRIVDAGEARRDKEKARVIESLNFRLQGIFLRFQE